MSLKVAFRVKIPGFRTAAGREDLGGYEFDFGSVSRLFSLSDLVSKIDTKLTGEDFYAKHIHM